MLSAVRRRLSPALVISSIALIVAVGGGTFALASGAVTIKIVKKVSKKVATKQIKSLAPTLSVKHAASADTATNAGNADNLGGLAAGSYQHGIRWAYIGASGTVLASGGGAAPTVITEPPGVYYLEWGSPVTGDAVISSLAQASEFSETVASSPCGPPPLGVPCFKGSKSSSETLTYTTSDHETEVNRAFYIALIP